MTRGSCLLATATAALTLAACTPPPAPPAPPAPAAAARPVLPNDVRWVRTSAEYRAIFLEVYRAAADRLSALAAGRAPGTWGVILDADETVLDNSEYQRRLALARASFDPATWDAWVHETAAPALPGATAFTDRVRALGGRIAIVSNRSEAQCPATRENLGRVGIAADVVLCSPPGTDDKNPRFAAVQQGTAAPGLPPLAIVEWIGDNIEDFPGLHQDVRFRPDSALTRFGSTYFVLPNPTYGSWQRNPPR